MNNLHETIMFISDNQLKDLFLSSRDSNKIYVQVFLSTKICFNLLCIKTTYFQFCKMKIWILWITLY